MSVVQIRSLRINGFVRITGIILTAEKNAYMYVHILYFCDCILSQANETVWKGRNISVRITGRFGLWNVQITETVLYF